MEPGPGNAYNTLKDSELPWPEVVLSSGGKVRLDPQGYTKYRAVADRADRDRVFKAFFSSLKQFERTFGSTLDAHVKTHVFNKEVHKFGSALDAGLFDADVPSAVYKQLIDDVHKNLPALHRYLKLRRRMMGLDQLRYEDLYASIVKKVDLHYTPEEARDIVLKAVAPLGPDYQKDMKRAFDERWMDIMPTTGKRSGAYSTGAYGVHPYQLENFNGLYESVSTTVHELGHSMHTLLSYQHQPYVTSNYKIFVAEVASTLNENLLLHYMLSQTKDKDTSALQCGHPRDERRPRRDGEAGWLQIAGVAELSWKGGQRELKDGTLGYVRSHPQSPPVRIDDRTADRQAHPQAAGLGRIEGLEEVLEARRSKARTRIPHRDDYAVRPGFTGADQQF